MDKKNATCKSKMLRILNMAENNAKGTMNWRNFTTVVSAAILVGTETVGLGLATGWAVGGVMGLGPTGTLIAEAAFGSIGLFVLYVFYKKAKEVESVRN
jgi:hypothetical protein